MNTTQFLENLNRTFNKGMFKVKKHSPEILMVTGTIGIIGSIVLACKATTKVGEVLETANESIETIHYISENPKEFEEETGEEYSEKNTKKALTMVYAKTGLELTKLYGPAVLLGGASLFCMYASHGILKNRNLALAAYAASAERALKTYRGRVIERFGEELDREIRYNIKAKEVEETVVDEEGKEETVKKTIAVIDPNDIDDFSVFYAEGCIGHTKDPRTNLMALKAIQAECNMLLKEQGYLTLNEVYEKLGLPKNKWGQIVGWVFDEARPVGDNFVDFGIYQYDNAKAIEFVNGQETNILLHFNYDGNLLELLP